MAPDIAQRIQQVSQDVLRVGQGSLYPALRRLEAQGWIASEWGASGNNRKAKYYKLTAAGRKQLAAETEDVEAFYRSSGTDSDDTLNERMWPCLIS